VEVFTTYLTLFYLWLFAIDYLWLFEFIDYLWLFVSLIICNYLKFELFEVICDYCFLSYLWLFERTIILIIFIICCVVIWSYLKCWLIICYLDYLWLFDMVGNYLAALHGAKIQVYLMIWVTKTPLLMPGLEPETFECKTADITMMLHWCSNTTAFNMVYNHVSLSGTILKTLILYFECCRATATQYVVIVDNIAFLLLMMLLMLFNFMFSV
jgi:hypothetical protein